MTDLAADLAWFSGVKAENYQTLAASDNDAIRTDQKAAKEAAEKGKRWVGGESAAVKASRRLRWPMTPPPQAGTFHQQPATSTTSLPPPNATGNFVAPGHPLKRPPDG